MKHLLLTCISFLIVSACVAPSYNTSVVNQPELKWKIQRVIAYKYDNVTRIQGKLNASKRFFLPKGHIDIAVFTPEGNLITDVRTNYHPSQLTRRAKHRGGIHFLVDLDQLVPFNSVIKIAFHGDAERPVTQKTHSCIICA